MKGFFKNLHSVLVYDMHICLGCEVSNATSSLGQSVKLVAESLLQMITFMAKHCLDFISMMITINRSRGLLNGKGIKEDAENILDRKNYVGTRPGYNSSFNKDGYRFYTEDNLGNPV